MSGTDPELALFGLGSNVGDSLEFLRGAVRELESRLGPVRVSSVYRTDPVGTDHPRAFLNAVAAVDTGRPAPELLRAALEIEAGLGRIRAARNAPRTIDVDLLAAGDRTYDSPRLTLPHPRLHERPFVLVPLAEVAPAWLHPRLARTAAELCVAAGREGVERIGGPDLIEPPPADA